jgi:sugar phosphate isomerase/epimerase
MTSSGRLRIKCFRSLWGLPGAFSQGKNTINTSSSYVSHVSSVLDRLKGQGFDGIEASLNDLNLFSEGNLKMISKLLKEKEMNLIVGIYSGWVDYEDKNLYQHFQSVQDHIALYQNQIQKAIELNPLWINAHVGSDHWNSIQAMDFLAHANEIESKYNILSRISYETHRGRLFYSPWTTLQWIEAFPSIQLTLDFSHWCVVSERLLDTKFDQEEWLENKILPHVQHVHGRIGSTQHAQIYDQKKQAKEIQRFELLWDSIWRKQQESLMKALELKEGGDQVKDFTTFTPEYGPYPYALEVTDQNQLEVDFLCQEQVKRQRKRFNQLLH